MVNRTMDFNETEHERMNWINLAQDKDKWQVVTKQRAFQLHKMPAI